LLIYSNFNNLFNSYKIYIFFFSSNKFFIHFLKVLQIFFFYRLVNLSGHITQWRRGKNLTKVDSSSPFRFAYRNHSWPRVANLWLEGRWKGTKDCLKRDIERPISSQDSW